jgi:hypothetical protein
MDLFECRRISKRITLKNELIEDYIKKITKNIRTFELINPPFERATPTTNNTVRHSRN